MSAPLLSARLVELRKEKGVSQAVVSSYLGVSREAYSHYERNVRQPNLEIIMKLVNFYKIEVSDLINERTVPIIDKREKAETKKKYLEIGINNDNLNIIISENIMHLLKLLTGKNSNLNLTDVTKEDISFLSKYKKLDKNTQREIREFVKFKESLNK